MIPGEPEKYFQHLKIHSIKSTGLIGMNICLTAKRLNIRDFSRRHTSTGNVDIFNLIKVSSLQND